MRIIPVIVAGLMFGCRAPETKAPSAATTGASGLVYVVVSLDKLK